MARSTELCSQVNEGVREKENSDQLEWLQNHVHCDGLPEVDICLFSCRHMLLRMLLQLTFSLITRKQYV